MCTGGRCVCLRAHHGGILCQPLLLRRASIEGELAIRMQRHSGAAPLGLCSVTLFGCLTSRGRHLERRAQDCDERADAKMRLMQEQSCTWELQGCVAASH